MTNYTAQQQRILHIFQNYMAELPNHYKMIMSAVINDTMIGEYGLVANMDAINYVVRNNIPGSIIECGVWKGGSIKAMILMLKILGDTSRDVYLFDTYEGMTEPTENDINFQNSNAKNQYTISQKDNYNEWCYSPIEYVQSNILATKYPKDNIHFIKGDVLETVPVFAQKKESIAVLRLDTDWYESTKVEMDYLYDLIVPGGVLIIDDYGYWKGSRKAIDEFFAQRETYPLLHRVDFSRRMHIKQ